MIAGAARLLALALVLLGVPFFIAGCGAAGKQASASIRASASPSATPDVDTSAWSDEGAKLASMKASAEATSNPPPSTLPSDYGTWAYETNPVDITSDGPITLTASVPASLNVTAAGDGLGYYFPPDKQFEIVVSHYDEVASSGGNTIEVYAVVSNLVQPYQGFEAWLY